MHGKARTNLVNKSKEISTPKTLFKQNRNRNLANVVRQYLDIIKTPPRTTHELSLLIDLILINSNLNVKKSGTIKLSISGHDHVFYVCKFQRQNSEFPNVKDGTLK